MNDYFKLNHIEVGFANHPTKDTPYLVGALDTEVQIRKGKLRINLLTPALELTPALHNGLLDDLGMDCPKIDWLRLVTYHDLAIPTGDYNTQINCPYAQRLSGFEVYGFPVEVQFHGVINLQEGYLEIEGVLKSLDPNQTAQIPIEIRKSFEAAPLLPARTCYSLAAAKQVNPLEVYELLIKQTNLDSFPAAILAYKNLESLWMVGASQFKEFPTAFYELKSLHTIRLYNTAIAELSPAIEQFQELEELTIEGHELEQLPATITKLSKLRIMSFKYGNLKHLPASWHQLAQLQELNIEGNAFFTLPACLTQIKRLKVDQKDKQLFMDTRYNSENPLAIDADLFNLNAYPTYKEQLKTAIQTRTDAPILAEFEDFILDCSTVALALIPTKTNTIPLGASKVGGSPDLPKTWTAPKDQHGKYYLFHAQLNCSDLAAYQQYLPRKGMLYFFVNDEEYAQKPLVWYANEEESKDLATWQYTEETVFIDTDIAYNDREAVALEVELSLSLPNLYNSYNHGAMRHPNYAIYWNQKDDDWLDKMEELGDFLVDLERQLGLGVPVHHINGTVFTQHESPQEQAAIKFGGLAEEWLVLLNLDSIGAFNFWDAGTLTYCIHKKDLAIQNFSTISASIESS